MTRSVFQALNVRDVDAWLQKHAIRTNQTGSNLQRQTPGRKNSQSNSMTPRYQCFEDMQSECNITFVGHLETFTKMHLHFVGIADAICYCQ